MMYERCLIFITVCHNGSFHTYKCSKRKEKGHEAMKWLSILDGHTFDQVMGRILRGWFYVIAFSCVPYFLFVLGQVFF
ncbi:hypothetical protein KIV12_11845 [Bacillus altitudinis]|nr:hypothetical protein KIV12_11845 [Bacillus altitudinis]